MGAWGKNATKIKNKTKKLFPQIQDKGAKNAPAQLN